MANTLKADFLSPVGRLVQGNPFEKQTKDMQGNPLTVKTGPSAGQPTQRYFCAVAFSKTDPAWPAFFALLANAARAGFPTLFDAQGQCLSRDFSWKVADGDSTMITKPGETPNAQKEGFPGNWVVKFSSSFPPRVFYAGKYAPHEQIQDPNVLRRGYYVRIAGTIEPNGNAQKPGLYVNLGMVEFAGIGPEITSGPDANAVFGGNRAALPAGAQPLPMNGGNAPMTPGMAPSYGPGGPAGPAPAFVPPAGNYMTPGPQPGALPAMPGSVMPGMAVAPNPGILNGPGMAPPPMTPGVPMAPPAMPTPPAPVGPVMLPAAQGHSYASLIAAGWNDAALRAAGMMQ